MTVDILKRLIQYEEESIKEIQDVEEALREEMSLKVPMMDLDITTKLIMAGWYGKEVYVSGVLESTDRHIPHRMAFLKRLGPRRKSKGTITARDIERAKAVPIPSLMKFVRLQARCLWHTDKNPSLHYYAKGNRAHCFSCGHDEDSIGVYMALNNVDFATAVRAL